MNSNKGKQKFFVIYQITNLLDNRIYVGLHTTYNIDDKYMGSSKHLKKDMKELGRQNFKKEILHIFDNKEDMIKMEAEIVNREFCHRPDTYNKMVGGTNDGLTIDMITVKDKDGNTSKVYNDDPRYLSGELVGITKGNKVVRDKKMILVKDKNKNYYFISMENSKYLSEDLIPARKNEKQHINSSWLGRKQSKESKEKIGLANSIKQKGENNSQFGTCWVTKDNINKKIKKENLDEFINQGWIKGRKNLVRDGLHL